MLGLLIEKKNEIGDVFIHFHLVIQTQFLTQIQILRNDNGIKYFNINFGNFNINLGNYLQQRRIIHQSYYVHTP